MNFNIYENSAKIPGKEDVLFRHELDSKICKAIQKPMVIFSAGPGYGKTQSVTDFLDRHETKDFWINLCELDNLTSRFWEVLCYAVSKSNEEAGAKMLNIGFPGSEVKFKQLMDILPAYLYKYEQVIFVFDDFHVIYEKAIYHFLEKVMNADLEGLSIFILSRKNVVFQNLEEAKNRVSYITQEDMAFSLAETEELLQLMDKPAKKETIKQLWRFTEGWPAILVTAVRSELDLDIMVERGPSSSSHLFAEVLEKAIDTSQSIHTTRIYVQLSLLDCFSAELVKELAGERVEEVMDNILNNIFVQHDQGDDTYFFHSIYREYLKEQQVMLSTDERRAVYEQAAYWCEQKGLKIEAMQYYSYCGQYERIWAVLQTCSLICQQKTTDYYLEIMTALPEELRIKEPLIAVVEARLLLNNGRIAESEQLCQKILSDINVETNRQVVGETYILLAWLSMMKKDYNFIRYFKIAEQCLPEGSRYITSEVTMNNGNYALQLQSPAAGEALKYERAIEEAAPYMARVLNGCSYGSEYLTKASRAYFTMNIEEAEKYAEIGAQKAEQYNQFDIICSCYFIIFKSNVALGRYKKAAARLEEIKQKIKETGNLQWHVQVEMIEGWFYTKIGQSKSVPEWIRKRGYTNFSPNTDGRERLIRAGCYLEEGRYLELAGYLEYLEELFKQKNIILALIEICVLRAVSAYKRNELKKAMTYLKEAYHYAEANELFMIFLEYGNYTRSLLNVAKKTDDHGLPEQWISFMYAKVSTYAKKLSRVKKGFGQSEDKNRLDLTPREMEILRSLSQGLTREEIAEAQGLSINTVKSNLKNIYNKLGAVNKADAIRIAVASGLI